MFQLSQVAILEFLRNASLKELILIALSWVVAFQRSTWSQSKNSLAEASSKRKVCHLPLAAYDSLKALGLLDPGTVYFVQTPPDAKPFLLDVKDKAPEAGKKPTSRGGAKSLNSFCFLEPTAQYSSVSYFNQSLVDDDGVGPISIPFNFCFYGTNYNSFYINTNGNITFNGVYATYTPVGFPNNTTQPMIAPFWADVDFGGLTANNIGVCYYQINPTNAIITWYNVGYYNEQHDKKNTFQVIITDGSDPVLPPGNNVGFRYKDMQWTTGAASCNAGVGTPCTYNGQTYFCGGNGGFCGAPAVVGANRNNGIDFVQFGRFDHPGTDYAGPFGNSGVDWLDYQTFNFNVCTNQNTSNVPPVIQAANICGDTLSLCVGDTVTFTVAFLSPEQGQTTSVTANTIQGSGFTILNNTPGNVANTTIQFIASNANLGTNILQFLASDNGTPPANTTYYLSIQVDTNTLNPIITGNNIVCSGQTTTLSVLNGPYLSYIWNPGNLQSPTIDVASGTYTVTVNNGGCSAVSPPFTVTQDQPTVQILGNTTFCEGQSTTLSASPANFTSYSWSTGATTPTTQVSQAGIVTLTAVNSNGCQATASVLVTMQQANVTIAGPSETCQGIPVTLVANGQNIAQYQWSTGETSASIAWPGGTVYITVTTQQGCQASDTFTVSINPLPQVDFGPLSFCGGVAVPFTNNTTISSGTITSWMWTFQNGDPPTSFLMNPTVTFPENTQNEVTLTATSDKNCSASLTQIVGVFQGPDPQVEGLPLCFGDVLFRNQSQPGSSPITSYEWRFGDGTTGQHSEQEFVHSYPESNSSYQVWLVVADANGCKDSVQITVQTLTLLDLEKLNNIITANADGLNDELKFIFSDPALNPYASQCFNFTLLVFNRWGNLIYETRDFNNPWKPVKYSPGVYYWVLTYETRTGKKEKRSGTVTVVH